MTGMSRWNGASIDRSNSHRTGTPAAQRLEREDADSDRVELIDDEIGSGKLSRDYVMADARQYAQLQRHLRRGHLDGGANRVRALDHRIGRRMENDQEAPCSSEGLRPASARSRGEAAA